MRQLSDLGAAAERSVHVELQAFMQNGLPAIQHLLSEGAHVDAAMLREADLHAASYASAAVASVAAGEHAAGAETRAAEVR